jgi:hypothetical protein
VEGSVVPCARGLHAVALEQRYARWHKWDSEHYEVEFVGEVVAHGEGTEQKYVGRRARLLRQIPHELFWLEARAFVESLNQIAWFSNAGEALPDWDVYETWDAARKAAWDAAWEEARDAARDAAWKAAWDAALLAACIVAGLRRDGEHYRHAQARMTVWQAGYGLLGDYTDDEGKTRLIVYKKP